VAALLFAGAAILGEGPLKDLALALFVGMVSGAYSSIFIATPLLAQIKERHPEMRKLAARVATRRAKDAPRTKTRPAEPATEAGGFDPVDEPGSESGVHAGATAVTVTRAPAGTVPVRPVRDGAAKRPQPQHKPRSQRRN
jgi:preprotein translocase subunit SecF